MKKQLLLLVMILLPMVASADDAVEIDGIYYNLINKTKAAEVIRNPYGYSGEVIIPETITYEGANYSVTSIGASAFSSFIALTSVTIPNSVTSIGNDAFHDSYRLTSVTIGNGVKSIGKNAFYNCNIQSVHITSLEAWCMISFYDYYANPLVNALHLYLNGEEIKDLVIPNSVTSIGEWTFSGYIGLTSVTIPNSVTSIGESAFQNCNALNSVTIPNSVTSIGGWAFYGCENLKSVHISSLEAWCKISFGDNPLYYAHHLYLNGEEIKDLVIPNSVTSINGAFRKCYGLTSVTIPNSVTSIGNFAFEVCYNLTSVTIGNGVTSIGNNAFYNCYNLTSVTIPNRVQDIGKNAFGSCRKIKIITLGSGIKTINSEAFASCQELTDFYCYADKVPSTKSDAFKDSYIEYATLHVPTESVNAYRAADPWKNFKSIVSLDSGETPEPQKCEKPTISYNGGQLKFASATDGAEFISEITDTDIKKNYEATVTLTATYNISVYATKSGYDNSETATATLCWIDKEPTTEGITDGVAHIPSKAVLIQSEGGILKVEGIDDGTQVAVYTLDGKQTGSAVSHNGAALVGSSIQAGSTAIVKIGDKTVKVIME